MYDVENALEDYSEMKRAYDLMNSTDSDPDLEAIYLAGLDFTQY